MDQKDELILYYLNAFIDFHSLCVNTSLSSAEVLQRLQYLKKIGYQIEKSVRNEESYYYLSKELHKSVPFPPIVIPDDYFRALYISDTHYGSTFDNIYFADDILEYALLHNIHFIFHLGDVIEGTKFSNSIRISDTIEQVLYVVENYPQDSSVQNYILLGNHDVYSVRQNSFDISKILFDNRKDFFYLGSEKTIFKLYNSYVLLLHSPHEQRIIRKQMKLYPDLRLALAGHFHTFGKRWHGNCLELRVAPLSEGRDDFVRTGAYDITIPADFREILVRKLVFDPDLMVISKRSTKMRRKVL